MYSGTTIRSKSGLIMGAHQKIDRVSHRLLKPLLKRSLKFPTTKSILHFEGLNGPDGIKRKSPGRDEPWHFIDPHDPEDRVLLDAIVDHRENLTRALMENNQVRAAFEAAWLAHAVVDGLTPAHHEPFEEELERLRGEDITTRTSVKSKIMMPGGGSTKRFIKNNWEYWGAKGVMSTHFHFEIGVASTITPLSFDDAGPSGNDLIRLKQDGFEALFLEALKEIASLKMYDRFLKNGWTSRMAGLTKQALAPIIVRTVVLAWYECYWRALKKKGLL